jgi:hypothetical protein
MVLLRNVVNAILALSPALLLKKNEVDLQSQSAEALFAECRGMFCVDRKGFFNNSVIEVSDVSALRAALKRPRPWVRLSAQFGTVLLDSPLVIEQEYTILDGRASNNVFQSDPESQTTLLQVWASRVVITGITFANTSKLTPKGIRKGITNDWSTSCNNVDSICTRECGTDRKPRWAGCSIRECQLIADSAEKAEDKNKGVPNSCDVLNEVDAIQALGGSLWFHRNVLRSCGEGLQIVTPGGKKYWAQRRKSVVTGPDVPQNYRNETDTDASGCTEHRGRTDHHVLVSWNKFDHVQDAVMAGHTGTFQQHHNLFTTIRRRTPEVTGCYVRAHVYNNVNRHTNNSVLASTALSLKSGNVVVEWDSYREMNPLVPAIECAYDEGLRLNLTKSLPSWSFNPATNPRFEGCDATPTSTWDPCSDYSFRLIVPASINCSNVIGCSGKRGCLNGDLLALVTAGAGVRVPAIATWA